MTSQLLNNGPFLFSSGLMLAGLTVWNCLAVFPSDEHFRIAQEASFELVDLFNQYESRTVDISFHPQTLYSTWESCKSMIGMFVLPSLSAGMFLQKRLHLKLSLLLSSLYVISAAESGIQQLHEMMPAAIGLGSMQKRRRENPLQRRLEEHMSISCKSYWSSRQANTTNDRPIGHGSPIQ